MSIYQFLASDDPLKTIKNQKIELLSIEEAEARGLSMPNWYSKDMNIDRNKKIVLFAPDEECLHELVISEDNGSLYAKQYSNKLYHSTLQWRYSEKRAEQLKEYILEHLMTGSEIELWNIWLDQNLEPTIRRCQINSLTAAIIKETVQQDPYQKPCCLIICK